MIFHFGVQISCRVRDFGGRNFPKGYRFPGGIQILVYKFPAGVDIGAMVHVGTELRRLWKCESSSRKMVLENAKSSSCHVQISLLTSSCSAVG